MVADPGYARVANINSGADVTAGQFWEGKPWQNYCMSLLRVHYGPHSIQMVPDKDRGDLGIEAFAPSDGCVFQCYAAEEPLSTADLYEAQRDKLTGDLGKLKKKQVELAAMLGRMIVKTYVFMVPRLDSRRLIEHATTKATEVVGWNLSFIANDMRIIVVTDDDYAYERNVVFPAPAPLLAYANASDDEIAKWRENNDSQVANALRKLGDAGVNGDQLNAYVDALLLQFVEGENALDALRQALPDQWANAVRCKSNKERLLVLELPPGSGADAHVVVNMVTRDLVAKLRNDAPALDESAATTIAYAAVADWLMRCPLNLGAAS